MLHVSDVDGEAARYPTYRVNCFDLKGDILVLAKSDELSELMTLSDKLISCVEVHNLRTDQMVISANSVEHLIITNVTYAKFKIFSFLMQIKSFSVPTAIIELRVCESFVFTVEIGRDGRHMLVYRPISRSFEIENGRAIILDYKWVNPINSCTRLLVDDRFLLFQLALPSVDVGHPTIDYSNLQVLLCSQNFDPFRIIKAAENVTELPDTDNSGGGRGADQNMTTLDYKDGILLSLYISKIKYKST